MNSYCYLTECLKGKINVDTEISLLENISNTRHIEPKNVYLCVHTYLNVEHKCLREIYLNPSKN